MTKREKVQGAWMLSGHCISWFISSFKINDVESFVHMETQLHLFEKKLDTSSPLVFFFLAFILRISMVLITH